MHKLKEFARMLRDDVCGIPRAAVDLYLAGIDEAGKAVEHVVGRLGGKVRQADVADGMLLALPFVAGAIGFYAGRKCRK